MVLLALPPTMDSAPELCFCGRKTIESHEFWFCSTDCARLDSLRSLGGPECHYRNVVRDAYIRAGAPELQPRRMASAVHLRPGNSDYRGFANAPPPFIPPTNLPQQGNATLARRAAWNENMAAFPTLSGKVLTRKATAGELVAERHDRSRREGFPNVPSRTHPFARPGDQTFEQISLDAIPFPEHVPGRSLRRVPSLIDGLKNNTKRSPVAALLNFGRSRKGKEGENPERVFGHPVNTTTQSGRKESRKGRIL